MYGFEVQDTVEGGKSRPTYELSFVTESFVTESWRE